jgi:hypothetical protein
MDGLDSIDVGKNLIIRVTQQIVFKIIKRRVGIRVTGGTEHIAPVERPHIILAGVAGSVKHP